MREFIVVLVLLVSFVACSKQESKEIKPAKSPSTIQHIQPKKKEAFRHTLEPILKNGKHVIKDNQWVLVYEDEFDTLNENHWNVLDWEADKNQELQYYLPQNVNIEDGELVITSKKETHKGKPYTSGAVTTQGKVSFKYGKVEIRAKMPGAGKGIFPAFWMMPDNEEHYLPELDMMEYVGDYPTEVWHVLHYMKDGKQKRAFKKVDIPNLQEGYHTFGIEWTEAKVTFLVNDNVTFETTDYSPSEDMYLYINTAIGGSWPGNPDESVNFPRHMYIDYVKIYKEYEGD